MRRLAFAIPGDLATPTGGYAYDRRIMSELRALGWSVDVIGLGDGFPLPTAAQKHGAERALRSLDPAVPVVVDGLGLGVLPEAAAELAERHALIALVHHPLAYESGLDPAIADVLHASERTALENVHGVVVTSAPTARLLTAEFGVRRDRIAVARPGTDRAGAAAATGDPAREVRLLSVGAVVPRKGFDVLVRALAKQIELPWRLTLAGDTNRDPQAARQLAADIERLGLSGRVEMLGAVAPDGMGALYADADLFVLASRFEGYGMAYAEAIAHGLPVIGTTGGAIPETVPQRAGVLVPPDDVAALAQALRLLIANADERGRLAAGARSVAADLPTWRDTARIFADAIEAAMRTATPARTGT